MCQLINIFFLYEKKVVLIFYCSEREIDNDSNVRGFSCEAYALTLSTKALNIDSEQTLDYEVNSNCILVSFSINFSVNEYQT